MTYETDPTAFYVHLPIPVRELSEAIRLAGMHLPGTGEIMCDKQSGPSPSGVHSLRFTRRHPTDPTPEPTGTGVTFTLEKA